MTKLEQPISLKIAKIIKETADIKTFGFYHPLGAKPGQFILLWLPRLDMKPFGVSRQSDNYFEITVCKVGPFTAELFKRKVGDTLGVQGPYGTSFSIKKKNVAMVAGGFGVAPLAFLADTLHANGSKITFIYGARSKDKLAYRQKLKNKSNFKVIWATNDGSLGYEGFVTGALEEEFKNNKQFDMFYSCGPEVMMAGVLKLANQYNVPAELSLERYMKCGFGVCGQCCVNNSGLRICKDGPVLSKEKVKKFVQEFGNAEPKK